MSSRLIAAALLSACIAGPASANITLVGNYRTPFYEGGDIASDVALAPGEDTVRLQLGVGGFASASLYAQGAPGVLRAEAASSASLLDGTASTMSNATAIWSFSARLVNPALTGTAGRLTFSHLWNYDVDGFAFPYGPSVTEQAAIVQREFDSIVAARTSKGNALSDFSESERIDNLGNVLFTTCQHNTDATGSGYAVTRNRQDLTIDFVWGETIRFETSIETRCFTADVAIEGNGIASCKVSATGLWGGFSNVLSNGVAVASYGVETDESIDLRQSLAGVSPVPEPKAWMMLMLAGALFALRRRFTGA